MDYDATNSLHATLLSVISIPEITSSVIDRSLQQNLGAKDRFKSDRSIDLIVTSSVIDRSLQQNFGAKDRFKSGRSIDLIGI